MDQRDYRRVADPARRQERSRIDLVDNDVEAARTFLGPKPTRGAIDAEPAPPADDLHAVDRLALGPARNRRRE
jgi:hypothetical protein